MLPGLAEEGVSLDNADMCSFTQVSISDSGSATDEYALQSSVYQEEDWYHA